MKTEIELAAENYDKEYYASSDIKEPADHFKAGIEWCFSRYGLPDEIIKKLAEKTYSTLPEDCQSKEDGICRLPINTCKQCHSSKKYQSREDSEQEGYERECARSIKENH